MRALRLGSWGGELVLEEGVPDPEAGPGEVLVKVLACGIGLTVLNCVRGDLGADPANLPRIPGHELVGVVTGCGAGVDRSRTGELVAAYFYLSCGHCPACYRGSHSLCESLGGYVGVDRDGGYAELVALPAANALPLPPGIDAVEATVVPDAVATPVHVAGVGRVGAGQRVAVVAAGGGVGVHMVQVARLHGADVAGLEASDEKLAFLESELGVVAIDSSDFGRAQLPGPWRGGADVIIDFLGSRASLAWALSSLDLGGRLVVVTTFPDVDVPLLPRDLVLRQRSVLGSRYCGKAELLEAAALVRSGAVRPVIGERVSLAGVEAVHGQLREGSLLGRGALVLDQR
ncbi:MAG: alcohol dehydrogenase catalytic domain-containing protein [Acidimicrobiales bacterium]